MNERKSIRDVRPGRKTLIDTIVEYFVSRVGEVITPREISDKLNLDPRTTVTTINRLVSEGTLQKVERGKFMYVMKIDVHRDAWKRVYDIICDVFKENFGTAIINKVTKNCTFDKNNPIDSVSKLINGLTSVLGRRVVVGVVKGSIKANFDRKTSDGILTMLKI